MIKVVVDRVFILGAGFSNYAGMPLQAQFTEALLEALEYKDTAVSKKIVNHVVRFVKDSFGRRAGKGHEFWPDLEDIFTCIDLSANSGHHLGRRYDPAQLRTIRRALLARMIRMLRKKYTDARSEKAGKWNKLERFVRETDWSRNAAISLNWDTVLEERIAELHDDIRVDYCCDAVAATFPTSGNKIEVVNQPGSKKVYIVKMHGSMNWLYCDNCRGLFHFPPKDTTKIAGQLLGEKDWQNIGEESDEPQPQWTCADCKRVPLGTRIATFSYRKALEFPMFQKSWFAAASLLRAAKTWVFIGYSLPPADFEFKYLLKRIQLSRTHQPRLILVTGGERAEATAGNYRRFFGPIDVFDNGITEEVYGIIPKYYKPRSRMGA